MDDVERQKHFYQTIFNLSYDGIVGVDNDGRIIIINEAGANFLGISISEATKGNIATINPKASLLRVLADQSFHHDEIRRLESHTAIINRAPVYYNDELIGAVSSMRDITELQQYEETIRRNISQQGLQAKWTLSHLVAESEPMQHLLRLAHRYAAVDSTLLLQGESGTGKEMLAQGIHSESRRSKGPFVALNYAAVPETLRQLLPLTLCLEVGACH
ncbi:sigma 54-interacting transcriptional regulator [Sulfoacidibacillus ferrooxidans]|uniref:Anaerobic nitric oxide reductase transcription regulator NorR n=1 Tax=Sulfoacidibacillus ferrooxidans TaxID=2005001 RepID=A0A9X1VAS5_9BACL|nr:sigma 54-interacting transcriptional regulator [Sulfoacidibacillus ferrooxidans]MCI0184247.1 Anaerobic nitric oxide reductase transcription regulator NorR [Sulfoacidibacillus ferrooxidans]